MAIIQQIYPFTTSGNYTFPASIEVTGGVARLALADNAGQTFNQDFAVDTGFTYSSAITEFAAGVVRQINSQPTNSVSWATYENNINLNFGGGVLTGTANGGAAISGNKLDLNYGDSRYVSYSAASNITPQQTGCIKLKYTPNYSGTPAATVVMFSMNESVASNNNELVVFHQAGTGELRFNQRNAAGTSQAGGGVVWNPVLGTEYEIELNYDLTAGNCRLFVNGALHVADLVTTGTRSATINHFVVGTNWNESTVSNFSIADFVVFSTVQHTAPYAAGYTLQEYKYSGDLITLPAFNYVGIGNIQSFNNIAGTDTNGPRYIVNNQYWNGSAWVATANDWSTSSPLATVIANRATIPVADSITFKVVTNNNSTTQMSVDDLTLTYTGQIYNTGNPVIYPNSGVSTTEFSAFAATTNAVGLDAVRFILRIDGVNYWWDGGAWATSSGYAETNTIAEINAQVLTLNAFITGEVVCVPRIYLHSNDGSTTPDIDELTIDYRPLFQTVQIQGFIQGITGSNSDLTRITVELNLPFVKYGSDILSGDAQTLTVSSGEYDFNLVETDNMVDPDDSTTDIYYIFTIEGRRITKTVPASFTTTDILSLPDYVETT